MRKASCDIEAFLNRIQGNDYEEMILLTDREATQAERYALKHKKRDDAEIHRQYACTLKGLMIYLRHGAKPLALRDVCLDDICPARGDLIS